MTQRISVAMATYNGESHIREQLDSIAGQTHSPFELVISDDCSSDRTLEIIRVWADTCPFPVRLSVNDVNLGFANNFLRAISLCQGDWIALSDQDDVWYPEKLERIQLVVDSSSEKDLVLVCHMADLADEKLATSGQRLPAIRRKRVNGHQSQHGFWSVGGCVMIFKASLLDEVNSAKRPPDDWLSWQQGIKRRPWLPHDKWICMLANALGSTILLPEALGVYRRHGATVTGSHAQVAAKQRLLKASKTGSSYYGFFSRIAQRTANDLREISSDFTDVERKNRLKRAAAGYETIAQNYATRARMYSERSSIMRLKRFFELLLSGSYLGNQFCSLGAKSLIKDAVVTLIGSVSKSTGH